MGRTFRQKPSRLAEKLLHIRRALGLSQNQLIRRLGFEELVQGTVSAFESGGREPSLLVLLAYARAANVSVESLIDDSLDLPIELPVAPTKVEGVRQPLLKSSSKRKPKR
jgi:transcriptional regulator with XRE-family HTH domain